METKGDWIKRLREYARKTRRQLAKDAGLSVATVSEYERGKYEPKPETVAKLAKALNVPVDAILDMPPGSEYDNPQPVITKKLPLLGEIPAGGPREEWEVVDYIDVLAHQWGPNRYALRVSGDSMSPILMHGDLIILEGDGGIPLDAADQHVCACVIDGEKTLKRVCVDWSGAKPLRVVLKPRNEKYKSIEILPEKFDNFLVVGIVLCLCDRKI